METERQKILVIGKPECLNEALSGYAIQLAQRLKYDLFVVCVMPQAAGASSAFSASEAAHRHHALKILHDFKQKAAGKNVHCDHAVQCGEIAAVADAVLHAVRRIEFVVTDSEYTKTQISEDVTIPVFSLSTKQLHPEGKPMTRETKQQRKTEVKKTIGYGLITAALYGAVFWNADAVMSYFTKGGFYAALPVATVFLFSFAHGAFASNLWSLMGIKPMKKETLQPSVGKTVTQTKKIQKRPRAYAYINPFHKI
ncbi:MAG: hypothetical protein V1844_16185 [Pseudomonadota bacterium]